MAHLWRAFKAFGAGAAAMYLFDPERGPNRRANLRRDCANLAAFVGDAVDRLAMTTVRNLGNQADRMTSNWRSEWLAEPVRVFDEATSNIRTDEHSAEMSSEKRMYYGVGGSLLALFALRQRAPLSWMLTLLGAGLMAKAVTGGGSCCAAEHPVERGSVVPENPRTPAAEESSGESWRVATP